jgi:hypothetical protein
MRWQPVDALFSHVLAGGETPKGAGPFHLSCVHVDNMSFLVALRRTLSMWPRFSEKYKERKLI